MGWREKRILFHHLKVVGSSQFRFIEYYLDGLFDPLKIRRCDFSNGAELHVAFTADEKKYSIFDPEYWDKQWRHWGESKKFNKKYYEDIAHLINKRSGKVFEIGCGPGYLAEHIHTHIHYKGIDISQEAIIMAKKIKSKNFEFYVDKIENVPSYLANNEFDTFVAIDILEHLNDDLLNLVIKEICEYKHFKFLYVVSPYLSRVQNLGHIQYFSKSKIKDLLGQSYILKFKPYRNYTELLTIGQRK